MQPNELKDYLEGYDGLELDRGQIAGIIAEAYRQTAGNGPYPFVSEFAKHHGIDGQSCYQMWANAGEHEPTTADIMDALDAAEAAASAGINWAAEVAGIMENDAEAAQPAIVNMAAFMGANVPEAPEYAIEGLCVMGESLQLVGPEKCGKSYEALRLALTCATGGTYRGHRCRRGRVLYVNVEMLDSMFKIRAEHVRVALGLSLEAVGRNFDGITVQGHQLDGAAPTFESLYHYLSSITDMRIYDYVFIDPIYKLEDGDENSAQDTARWVNVFDRMRKSWACTLVYVHHTGKGAGAGQSAYQAARGHSNFGDYAGSQITITPLVVRPDTDAWDALEAAGIEEPSEGAAYRIRMGGRDAPRAKSVNVYRLHPLLVEDTEGILDECPMWGDIEGKRRQGVQCSNRRRGEESRGAAQRATARAVEACKAAGNTADRSTVHRFYLAEACEAEGIRRPTPDTFKKWTSNPTDGRQAQTSYRLSGGELVDTNDSK